MRKKGGGNLTERLYELQPNLDTCQAEVFSCEQTEQGWRIELNKTVLFPEGGGQLCDRGTIAGVEVLSVFEENGRVFHVCETAIPVGSQVNVELDKALRQYHSQQHTGEHILSHAFWKLFGAVNIGFHSDEERITIDLDQELDREQCARAERYANEQIWRNGKVDILYRNREDMDDLNVRKVTDKADGLLRVVVIEGGDVCTCCGTHVERTGSVGMIKIVSIQRHRGGTRLEAVCGSRALEDYASKVELVYQLSCNLSCGVDTMGERIESLKAETRNLSARLRSCSARLMDYVAAEALRNCAESKGKKCIMVPLEGDAKEAKQLLNRLTAEENVMAGVFYADGERVGYLIAKSKGISLSCREVSSIANGLLNGKGGGSDVFAQGSGKYSSDWRELVGMVREASLRMMQ